MSVLQHPDKAMQPIDIGTRLELFVDHHLIDVLDGVSLVMHHPHPMPRPAHPLTGAYITVIYDGDRYRGYYRAYKSDFTGERADGNRGECTCYVESRDGVEWEGPNLGVIADAGGLQNGILDQPPFAHNFSPFLDMRPGIPGAERYKALAGTRGSGLHAFASGDGIHWRKLADAPAIPHNPELHGGNAFDSQNVSFWSEAEGCYVCYFRHFRTPQGSLRTISRATSPDFLSWTDESAAFQAPNLPGEELYTSQTHPYFRATHIYLAFPTRFTFGQVKGDPVQDENGKVLNQGSTDVLFMTTRAGAHAYDRLFTEAFIRPGLDPAGWENRANYVALNVVPTGPGEMSIYNRSGHRYVLRTDGFASATAPCDGGELRTRPLRFSGRELVLNCATAIRGGIRVELQGADGRPLPGCALEECPPIFDDSIEHVVAWRGGSDVGRYAGRPVRLRIAMQDSDLYAFRFQ